ncbi:MAG: pilus assembly protein PilP [Pseudomonadota bacterium]
MILALLVLAACSHEPGVAPAAAPTPAPAQAATSPVVRAPAEPWSYNPIGKRDPYRSFVPAEPPHRERCPEGSGRVQCWPLEQLRLTGIVWGEHTEVLLEDPEGQGHVLGLNDYVGSGWGRITNIASDHVVVTEEYLDGDQQLITVQTRLGLVVPG